ncbi:MAG: hypothetical protein MUE69_02010 [Myxococcota bacterium]|nr:hypothetical protein [Myxococcota bacterium]
MAELSMEEVPRELKATASFAVAALHALAREEARDRKPKRLLEDGLATWAQFRGRLHATHLLELLLEDAAVTQPTAFRAPGDFPSVSSLPKAVVDGWVREAAQLELDASALDYLSAQAKRLGITTRMARSELHRVKAHHQILELPGTGAQLAHHLVSTHDDVFLQSNFVVACRDWRDVVLAGLVAVELGVSGPAPVSLDPDLRLARTSDRRFDYVIGLDPDKGGDFRKAQLVEWFPSATVVLV